MKISKSILGLILIVSGFVLGTGFSDTLFKLLKKDGPKVHHVSKANDHAVKNEFSDGSIGKQINEEDEVVDSRLNPDELKVIDLFEHAAPSVVFITTSRLEQSYWTFDVMEIPKGSGTGFMWDDQGHIVTNYHVIESGERYTVSLSDQTSYQATLIGAEPSKDLAVLKIISPAEKLKSLPVGISKNLKVGQSVYAIGNPFGFDQTLTTGVISALGREITALNNRKIYDVIQTDAAINPGNSGGPLLNSSGELIGVNTAIYSPSGAYSGIGFSIPVDEVKNVVPDLINYGHVKRPLLGISLVDDRYYRESGAMIKNVYPNGPAKKAGLKGIAKTRSGNFTFGDIIKYIDDFEIKTSTDLMEVVEKYKPNDRVKVGYLRNGEIKEVSLTLTSSVDD